MKRKTPCKTCFSGPGPYHQWGCVEVAKGEMPAAIIRLYTCLYRELQKTLMEGGPAAPGRCTLTKVQYLLDAETGAEEAMKEGVVLEGVSTPR